MLQGSQMRRVDWIYDVHGDWVVLYVDGHLRFQGHEIRDDDYKTLFQELGIETNDYEEADFSDGSGASGSLEELRNGRQA
jgi:hypothetical protein